MSAGDTVDRCLTHFCAFTGAPLLALNTQGVCSFKYQDRWDIGIELPKDSSLLYFYGTLLDLPVEGRLNLYATALKLNAYCMQTRGATIALDTNAEKLLLCYLSPLESLDEVRFTNILNNFVQTLQNLHEILSSDTASQPEHKPTAEVQFWGQRV